MEAAAYLHDHPVDLLFLDIKMPDMTGMELLKTLTKPPKVIIATAFSEYALEGYEYAVVDYLLKPVPFERFLKAVNRSLKAEQNMVKRNADPTGSPPSEFLFIKVDRTEHKIKLSDICCIEAWRNSAKIYVGDEILTVPKTITELEAGLPRERFIRIHKSFIAAIEKIVRIQGNKVYLKEMTVPIGKYYKKDLQSMMDKHRLKGRE